MASLSVVGPVTNQELRASPIQAVVYLGNSSQLDAFSRLRVSTSRTLFDSQQEYGLDTLRNWDATANGTLSNPTGQPNGSVVNGSNLVGPRNANTRLTPITCSSTDTHYAILQSRAYQRYIPGKGHLILLTGVYSPEYGSQISIVRRTSTSGSVVDNKVNQADWNVDKLDGTGPSGITLDLTKTQILVISAQWLGVGRVTIGFDVDGVLCPAHEFLNANELSIPYTQAFNLPVRMEIRTSGTTAIARSGYFDSANGIFLEAIKASAGGTIQFCCCSVQSEGGEEVRGFPSSSPPLISTIGVTTRRPVLSIRPSLLYQGLANRAWIQEMDCFLRATTNDAFYEIVLGGTLTGDSWLRVGTSVTAGAFVSGISYVILTVGSTDFTLIGAVSNTVGLEFTATGVGAGTGTAAVNTSCTEYDISASAISGGVSIAKGFAISGSGSTASFVHDKADIRNPLVLSKIDSLSATQNTFSIVCTSFTGTSNITAVINWHELVT